MRAWTVDADDIQVAEDFNESLLHRTPEIEGFLRSDRDDKFIVIGTKGFGKTLLLKAKRILYQREGRAACLPTGALLDKPIGDKIFSRELLAFFVVSPLPWSKIWLTAICLATLKHLGAVSRLTVGPSLASLIEDEQLQGVIDHFVRLLEFTPSELQRCGTDTDGHLVPRLRAVTSPSGRLHRWSGRILQQARRGPHEPSQRHRRAVAEHMALRATRSGGGFLSAAPDQPSYQGICCGAQRGLCAPREDDGHGPAVPWQRCRYFVLAVKACARSS